DGPRGTRGHARVRDTERDFRDRAGERPDRGGGRERGAPLEREEERDRPRGERESHEPAADRVPPAAGGKARAADQRGCEHELEQQGVHVPANIPEGGAVTEPAILRAE